MKEKKLNHRIRHFYDRSTPLWLDVWGEHMHHGYYGPGGKVKKDHRQAQIDLIEELLRWGRVENAGRILDAGCGIGGSARYLSGRFGAEVLGLTLSPVQAAEAVQWTERAGLSEKVRFDVRDVLTLTPADRPFDLIWSLESAEHMEDKKRLLEIFYDLLAPGGRLVMATWCYRDLPPPLTAGEKKLLNRLYALYHLPPMISIGTYQEMALAAGFREVETADWSDAVAPFWQAVIHSAFRWESIRGLMRSGWPTLKGAWAMRYMTRGYKSGLIRFGLIRGKKP